MFDVGPQHLRNANEVEDNFVIQYLLPLLGYTRDDVILQNPQPALWRLATQLFGRQVEESTRPRPLIIEVRSPQQQLDPHVWHLYQSMTTLNIAHGLLTNAREVRIYRKRAQQIEQVFACAGDEVLAYGDEINRLIGRDTLLTNVQGGKPVAKSVAPKPVVPNPLLRTNRPAVPPRPTSVETETTINPITPEPPTQSFIEPPSVEPPSIGNESRKPTPVIATMDESSVVTSDSQDVSAPEPSPPEPSPSETTPIPRMNPLTNLERKRESMKVVAIYHNKGGVGKTTVAVNLAAALRNRGHRVLLIDLDSQANSTFATGLVKFQFEEDDDLRDKNVYHVLESGDFFPIQDVVRSSNLFNQPEIDVVPSHISLIEGQYKLNQVRASQTRLIKKLRDAENRYDYVLIDTPPSRDIYAQVAIIAANHLIIPSDLKPFANQGLTSVRNFIKEIDEFRESLGSPPINILGVLPSKISTNKRSFEKTFPRQKEKILQHYNFTIMESIIHERVALSHAVNQANEVGDLEIPDPKSIFAFAKTHNTAAQAAAEFDALAEEVIRKVA